MKYYIISIRMDKRMKMLSAANETERDSLLDSARKDEDNVRVLVAPQDNVISYDPYWMD